MEAGGRIQQDDPVANRSTGQSYDADGRVRQIETADGHRVESIYDFRGERIARIVNRGQPSQAVTFYYGKYLSVTGNQMTRAFYLGNRLIAESTIAAPAGLTLARSLDPEQRIMVARAIHDAVGRGLYPHVHLGTTTSVALGGTIAILCIGLFWLPGQRRVAIIGKVRRGRVLLIVIVFGASLTPLPWVEPAEAGCTSNCGGTPPPAPPKFPTLFVHGDHLGSTVLLTCYEQPGAMSCGNGSVYRYLRYDAYGRMSAYNASQIALARGQEGTERTYTGQRWDWQAQVYDYGARFYDPRIALFLSLDPIAEHANPYAYVLWQPTARTDPLGASSGFGGALGAAVQMSISMALAACGGGCENAAIAAAIAAGHVAGGSGEAATNGGTTPENSTMVAIGEAIAQAVIAAVVSSLPGGYCAPPESPPTTPDGEGPTDTPGGMSSQATMPQEASLAGFHYVDINYGQQAGLLKIGKIALPVGWTFGVMFTRDMLHFYAGGGVIFGRGGSLTAGTSPVSPGLAVGFQYTPDLYGAPPRAERSVWSHIRRGWLL